MGTMVTDVHHTDIIRYWKDELGATVLFSFVKGVKASYVTQALEEEWKKSSGDSDFLCPYLSHLHPPAVKKVALSIHDVLQQ